MVRYMNKNIFREYDIRGIADTDLTNDTVYLIGKAFGNYLYKNNHKPETYFFHFQACFERCVDLYKV